MKSWGVKVCLSFKYSLSNNHFIESICKLAFETKY